MTMSPTPGGEPGPSRQESRAAFDAIAQRERPSPPQATLPCSIGQRVVDHTGELATSSAPEMRAMVTARLQALTKTNKPGLLEVTTRVLADAKVTVNFPTKYLDTILDDGSMKNFWQVPREAGYDHRKYATEREATERTLHPVLDPMPDLASPDPARAAERPNSAALNIGGFAGGAAPVYGTSYMVLRDDVKKRSTITAGDSLEHHYKKKLGPASVGTEEHLLPVLHHMEDDRLRLLGRMGLKDPTLAPPGKFVQYPEVQVFGGIDLRRDVRTIVIDRDELEAWKKSDRDLPDPLKGLSPEERSARIDQSTANLQRFCDTHRIELQYYGSGKSSTGMFDNAKVYRPST